MSEPTFSDKLRDLFSKSTEAWPADGINSLFEREAMHEKAAAPYSASPSVEELEARRAQRLREMFPPDYGPRIERIENEMAELRRLLSGVAPQRPAMSPGIWDDPPPTFPAPGPGWPPSPIVTCEGTGQNPNAARTVGTATRTTFAGTVAEGEPKA